MNDVVLGKEEGGQQDDESEKEGWGGGEGMSVAVLVKGGGDADYV